MSKGTFSISVHLDTAPQVQLAVDNVSAWLVVDTFTDDNKGLSSLTVHLPNDPRQVRLLAHSLYAAADAIEVAKTVGVTR